MYQSTEEMLRKGYLLFPKVLFEEQMKMTGRAGGYFDAFILVLTHVNYSTVTCNVNGCTFKCERGESVLSFSHWAEIFGWGRGRTRRFFARMFEEGIIEQLLNQFTTHIRIPDYDLLVGQRKIGGKRNKSGDALFNEFWEKFHDELELPKVNIGRARREWRKLSPAEQELAIRNIGEYHYHHSDPRFCLQAAGYLADKAFADEYID